MAIRLIVVTLFGLLASASLETAVAADTTDLKSKVLPPKSPIEVLRANKERTRDIKDFRRSPKETLRVVPPNDYEETTGKRSSGDPLSIDRCQKAARAYVDYMANHAVRDPDQAAKLGVTQLLVSDCMKKLADVPDSEVARAARQVVGSLTFQKEPWCMASRVSIDRIVTARHCIYKYDGTLQGRFQKENNLSTLRFVLAADPKTAYTVTPVNCASNVAGECGLDPVVSSFDLLHDVIELRLIGADNNAPTLRFDSTVSPGDNLFLVGASALLSGLNRAEFSPEFLTMSPSVGCVVGAVDNACIYHGCISEPNFSGTPIIRVSQSGAGAQVIGLHLASTGSGSGVCRGEEIGKSGNVALRSGYGTFTQGATPKESK